MSDPLIDTLRYADRLKDAGFKPQQAEGMARALADEMTDRLVTRTDLDSSTRKINGRIDALGTRINALETKFEAFGTRFEALDMKIDSVYRELSSKFNILLGVMVLGFSLTIGLGVYNGV